MFEVRYGFNTKQWWILDNERNCYVDVPIEVLNFLKLFDFKEQAKILEELVSDHPSWLYDEDFCFYDENFEI